MQGMEWVFISEIDNARLKTATQGLEPLARSLAWSISRLIAQCLGGSLVDLDLYSLSWGSTGWGSKAGGLNNGNLQARITDFESGFLHICL